MINLNTRELRNILEERKSELKIKIAKERAKSFNNPMEIMEKQMRLVELNSILYIIEHGTAPELGDQTKTLEQMKSYMHNQIKQNVASELQNQGK